MKRSALSLCLFATFAVPAAIGQNGQIDESLLDAFTWRSVGPAGAGGRIVDVEVVGNFPHTIFVAGATGGLWRSENNGVTFEPIFDDQATNSIGAIAIHPNNPDIIWVGTGEANPRNSVSWGDGVYKSTDGGETWRNLGLRDSHHIGRIVIDPNNPETAYVAAVGHFWAANEERGVYKTTDGGESWERVLFIDRDTGVVDLAMDPRDSGTLYAAAYQVRRDGFSGGNPGTMTGPGGGLYKTTNAGRSWRELTQGLPTSDKGRIGISVSRTDPEVVYAIVQTAGTEDGGVFRSTDRGESWEFRNSINPRPFYYSQIRVDPNDADRVYVLGGSVAVSNDGGETFDNMSMNVHVDHHDLWINPESSDHLVLGNDGGVYFSYDRGASWDFLNQMAIGQLYAIDVDMREPYYIYGGVQDYCSWAGPSATRDTIGITEFDWYKVMTGDGFQVRIDPNDYNTLYAESQNGGIVRHDHRSGQNTSIKPTAPEGEDAYRFNWETPIHISYHDSQTIYVSGNHVFRSRNRGDEWEVISPDLTTATTSRPDGEPRKVASASAFAESPLNPELLYAGTDDGHVWVTDDGGATWSERTDHFPGLSGKRWVSRLVASRFEELRAYATFDGHRNDDFAPHVYMSTDAGESWKSIAANLPDDGPVRVIREDVKNPDLLFVGTEFAAFVSFDRGGHWLPLMNGMPTVAVADLVVHPTQGDLIAGTHGRSAYVMDITPLQELTPNVAAADLHLFSIENAVAFRYRVYSNDQFLGEKRFVAANPPYGAAISYLVGAASEGQAVEAAATNSDVGADGDDSSQQRAVDRRARITITDASGATVRELRGPADEGLHRVRWDLKYGALPRITGGGRGRGGRGGGRGRGGRGGGSGPLAQPGIYQVKLEVAGREATTTVEVEADPQLLRSEAERAHRWEVIGEIRELQTETSRAAQNTRSLVAGLESLEESVAGVEAFDDSLKEMLAELLEEARELGRRQDSSNSTLSGLYRSIESSPFAPTATQLRRLEETTSAHQERSPDYDNLIETRVPALEKAMNDAGIPRVVTRRRDS